MSIRKAEPKDLSAIQHIANVLTLPITEFVWNSEDFIMRQVQNGEYFILEEHGEALGIISLRNLGKKIRIETLAIRDGFAANGYGRELLTFAKQYAKDQGFAVLQAYSFFEYNIKDFYLKHGFTLLDYTGNYKGHQYYCFEVAL